MKKPETLRNDARRRFGSSLRMGRTRGTVIDAAPTAEEQPGGPGGAGNTSDYIVPKHATAGRVGARTSTCVLVGRVW
jgi:hypothetical protein